ncbi:MAG: COX15/CtaA family protein [Flavobacteriales bacterium]
MTSDFHPSRSVVIWLWAGIVLILIMVIIGGMTRLTHSGLSMVHWTFHGSLPPMDQATWMSEFERYQQSPEFKEVHSHFTVEEFKSIYWWEFGHRMFGRMIGMVFLIPFGLFLWKKKIPKKMLPKFLIILGLGAFQALLGWFMVKSGLIDVPRVSHYRLAAHLVTAFITCAYILWVTLDYQQFGKQITKSSLSKTPLIVFGAMLILQIIFGGFVAGLRAGWIHNTWPLMDGEIISSAAIAMDPLVMNFLEGRSGVQFVHRTLGFIVMGYALWLWLGSKLGKSEALKMPVKLLAAAVLTQFILGVSTLLLEVPTSLAVVHQVFALVTLLSATWLLHRSYYQLE